MQVKKRRKSGTKLKCTMLNQWAQSKSAINNKDEVEKILFKICTQKCRQKIFVDVLAAITMRDAGGTYKHFFKIGKNILIKKVKLEKLMPPLLKYSSKMKYV